MLILGALKEGDEGNQDQHRDENDSDKEKKDDEEESSGRDEDGDDQMNCIEEDADNEATNEDEILYKSQLSAFEDNFIDGPEDK